AASAQTMRRKALSIVPNPKSILNFSLFERVVLPSLSSLDSAISYMASNYTHAWGGVMYLDTPQSGAFSGVILDDLADAKRPLWNAFRTPPGTLLDLR